MVSPNNSGSSGQRDIKIDLTPAPVRSIYEILLSPKGSPHQHGPMARGAQRLGAGRYVLNQKSVQSKGPFPPLKETLDDAEELKKAIETSPRQSPRFLKAKPAAHSRSRTKLVEAS